MAGTKSSFIDKVLGRIDRLAPEGLQTVVQRLAREKNFLEVLFNTIEDGVLVVDQDGGVLYFNQTVTQLIGLPPDTPSGHSINRYLPGMDWPALCVPDPEKSKRVVRHEFEVAYPCPRFLRLFATPLEGENTGIQGVALILHDLTEERQKTHAAIESERLQALTLLAASVAHEIGNPLNALNIHLQLMEREVRKLKRETEIAEPPSGLMKTARRAGSRAKAADSNTLETAQKLERFLAVAKGEITRLDYIITQFLQAIRPSPPKPQWISLNEVVESALELLKPELENRGIGVEEHLTRQLPLAPLDPNQIKQMLVNLIKNAMQAQSKGGLLSLATGQASLGVWVSVRDTGCGIPQETINRIFEPFYTTKQKGSGLGLMIVQRIVRDHGGRIELESRVNHGTTFRIWLPVHEPQPRLLEAHIHD